MVENVSARDAWQALREDPNAVLCDVRTAPECNLIGGPDLSSAGKEAAVIPWQIFPAMQTNPNFLTALAKAGITPEKRVFFMCRVGGRGMAAAQAAEAAGYEHASNVIGGFEGPPDEKGHRGTLSGWKAEGLPWRQS